jgi:hypothetical protein
VTDAPPRNRWVAAGLAWAFPGLGHLYLGKRGRAVAYAAIVAVTFCLGLQFEGRLWVFESGQPLTLLAMFAIHGAGILPLAARALLDNPGGSILSVTFEYGNTFLLTAGLMNLLLMLDAFDIAAGRKS